MGMSFLRRLNIPGLYPPGVETYAQLVGKLSLVGYYKI